jgi:hypothetical protein
MPYCLSEKESAHKAFYYLSRFQNHKTVIVVNSEGSAVGILTPGDLSRNEPWLASRYALTGGQVVGHRCYDGKTVGDICNRDFKYIRADEDKYTAGRNIFADAGLKILDIPVLNDDGIAVDIFARWQAFYKEYLETHRLQRMWYAEPIMQAAQLARKKGYSAISAIEFGVGGGTGLVLAELYAKETARLTGVAIDVYGFDLGTGLPEVSGIDKIEYWKQGDYAMDISALQGQLRNAKLILGDIGDTVKTFFKDYSPAPIGAMFVDVDLYSSTLPVLDMLLEDDAHFLPTVYMCFDDLYCSGDYSGEWLAIKEFNAKSANSKIVPEGLVGGRSDAMGVMMFDDLWWSRVIKRNIRFSHPKIGPERKGSNPLELLL